MPIYERGGQRGRPKGSKHTDEQKQVLEKLPQHIITIIMNIAPFNSNYLKIVLAKQNKKNNYNNNNNVDND